MMIRTSKLAAVVLATGLAGGVSAVPTPSPLVEGTKVGAEAVAALDKGELSVAFEARFDAQPSKGSPTDLFPVSLEADGRVKVTIPAEVTSFEGDYTCRSQRKVKKGELHHYAVVYSLMRQRFALYIDNVLEYENDNIYLPTPAFGGAAKEAFTGKVGNFRAWDIELESERLMPDPAAPGKTLFETRTAANGKALAARLDAEFAKNPAAVRTDSIAVYTTDPTAQERVMPDAIPAEADFSGTLDVVCAQDEFEPASLVVMARKPVGSFTVKMGELSCNGVKFPASSVDIRLVKRWYRSGGAWFSYFADFRHRVLTPHLLVYDDDLIRVDEVRTRNYYRLDYPEGTVYTDVSDPARGRAAVDGSVPFNDAKTLQPIRNLTAFGRNQQYWILFHAAKDAKPGLYTGNLDLVADGKTVKMPVRFRVLPFALPVRGASYDDPSRVYVSHVNIQGGVCRGLTAEELKASALHEYKSMRDHNSIDVTGVWSSPASAALAREAGYPEDQVWCGRPNVPYWAKFFPGRKDLTVADHAVGLRAAERSCQAWFDWYANNFPSAQKWCMFFSEASDFGSLNINQQERTRIVHKHGWTVFAHGMSQANYDYAADIQDANIGTDTDRRPADLWHAVGGSTANYAKPFAAPENPAVHRRQLGFHRWKDQRFDGNMQHGMADSNPNQFAPDPGGDGNYRCQIMIYPTQSDFLETICWEGVREGFDDVRYGTYLKQLATPHLQDKDEAVRREARRALAWLELQDCDTNDMQAMRLGVIERILALRTVLKM